MLLFLTSLVIVGFGQPAWNEWFGILAAAFGYALFWRVLLGCQTAKERFWIGTGWFFAVQLIQLSWSISHPYLYIYIVYFLICSFLGMQFGCLSLFITPQEVKKPLSLLAIAGAWTLLEWMRLFIFSGFSWNPVGMALTANIYSLQMASLWGIYGLSFWTIYVNLLAVHAWMKARKTLSGAGWLCAAMVPYVYGFVHFHHHEALFNNHEKENTVPFHAVLVQTAFPVEETLPFWDTKKMIAYVYAEWNQILQITKKHVGELVDLIVFPEFTVPYGTYTAVFPADAVHASFKKAFGSEITSALPSLSPPLAIQYETQEGPSWFVSNAYWLQALANIFQTRIIAGLEDVDGVDRDSRKYFSAAQYFQPAYSSSTQEHSNPPFIERYEKRVLVPMGEYLPFTFFQKLAESYGIQGSFTSGKEAKVFNHPKIPLGISICYEETFGHLMRENRQQGAELLINLTSDVWYPNSRLPKQHADHARLRTVENGIPLIRACNTGITGGFDSLGRIIGTLGENYQDAEWIADTIKLRVPQYTYTTVYSRVGDFLIIGISIGAILLRWIAGSKFRSS